MRLYGVAQQPTRKLAGINFPLGLRVIEPPPPNECPDKQEFIVVRKERLHDQPNGSAGGDRVLDLYYRIGVKPIGSWALVCRDGVKLGYLPQEAVAPTR